MYYLLILVLSSFTCGTAYAYSYSSSIDVTLGFDFGTYFFPAYLICALPVSLQMNKWKWHALWLRGIIILVAGVISNILIFLFFNQSLEIFHNPIMYKFGIGTAIVYFFWETVVLYVRRVITS